MLRDSPLGRGKREEEERRQQRAMLQGAWVPPWAAEADRVGSGHMHARMRWPVWVRGACRCMQDCPGKCSGTGRNDRGNVTGGTELSTLLQYPPFQEPSYEEA